MCNSVGGLSWTGVIQETDASRYQAFLAYVCWVIRGYTDSRGTVAHKLTGCLPPPSPFFYYHILQ